MKAATAKFTMRLRNELVDDSPSTVHGSLVDSRMAAELEKLLFLPGKHTHKTSEKSMAKG